MKLSLLQHIPQQVCAWHSIAKPVLIALTLLSSPSVLAQTAQDAVEAWLERLDEADYQQTWQDSAPMFQAQISPEKWREAASAARASLGDVTSRKLMVATYRSELPDVPKGDYLIFKYQTQFTQRSNVIETITPVLVEGRWRISGYFVQ